MSSTRTLYHRDGQTKMLEVDLDEQGREHGVQRTWFQNGQLCSSVPISHGKTDGLSVYYNPLGQVTSQGTSANGKMVGVHQSWWTTGEAKSCSKWDEEGKQIWRRDWWKNGVISLIEGREGGEGRECWMTDGSHSQDERVWQEEWNKACDENSRIRNTQLSGVQRGHT
jgi:antitoxin component YwqK of YwqJK toxin-antitoxin module